jgi:Polyketide cyclase / dehydrase and lipid transport
MTTFTAEAITPAQPTEVWPVLIDVTDWPNWTPSYRDVHRLDEGPLAVGSRARVRQPRLSPAVYEVTEINEGREFVWQTASAGIRIVARHSLVDDPRGTRIELVAQLSGWLVRPVTAVLGRRIQRYVELEAEGIKAAAEAARDRTP